MWYNSQAGGEALASKTKKTQRKELLLGAGCLLLGLLVLLAVAFLLPKAAAPAPPPADSALTPNPYDPEDFQYEGGYLTCLAGESVLGVDVSSHQQHIDWQQVAGAGMEFAMIRVGYRGYDSGEIRADDLALQNYRGARSAGLKVGVYFFSQAVTVREAEEEAAFVLDQIRDWELDMPVVFDWEYVSDQARTGAMTAKDVMACTHAFNRAISQAGLRPMVYFNPYQAEAYLDLEALAQYPFWLAMYDRDMTFPYQVAMWQYTSQGVVPGIAGPVDINLWFPETQKTE